VAGAFNYQLIGAQNVIDFKEEPVTSTNYNGVDYYVPGITAAFIMTNGLIGLTSNTTEFKRRGIIKRLSITPLTKTDWIWQRPQPNSAEHHPNIDHDRVWLDSLQRENNT
jgi:ABC-2 type transport system permease protein